MNKFKILFLIFIISNILWAQEDNNVISQQQWLKIIPALQHYSIDHKSFSEFSIPIQGYYPVNRELSVSFNTSRANVSGEGYKNYGGLSDLQLRFNYFKEDKNLVYNLGINLPTGKNELSLEEYNTSTVLSLNQLNFRVPVLGQGFNLAPGITWAYPVNDNLVIGLGASYQFKSSFKPIKIMDEKYNPGNELLFTGGFDYKLDETATISTDLILTTYGKDKVGKEEIFASGKKFVFYAQYKKNIDHHKLLVHIRYRSKGKNRLAEAGSLIEEEKKTSPNQKELAGYYQHYYSKDITTGFLLEWRSFEKTAVWNGLRVIGLGVFSQITMSPKYKIPFQLKYYRGKFSNGDPLSGWEIVLGVKYDL